MKSMELPASHSGVAGWQRLGDSTAAWAEDLCLHQGLQSQQSRRPRPLTGRTSWPAMRPVPAPTPGHLTCQLLYLAHVHARQHLEQVRLQLHAAAAAHGHSDSGPAA